MADISGNQRRVLGEFLGLLQPFWRTEAGLPARIERLIRSDRRFGSRDRRLYRELIYTALRYLNWVEPWLGSEFGLEAIAWLAAETPATRGFKDKVLRRAAESGDQSELTLPAGREADPRFPSFTAGLSAWPPCPPGVAEKAAVLSSLTGVSPLPSVLPEWAAVECPVALEPAECDALHRRAPLWIRLQDGRPDLVAEEFHSRHWTSQRSELSPDALRIDAEVDLTDTLAFQSGMIEVQDLGSQLILVLAAPAPGERWLDACAGAGGKSLQLAQMLGPAGQVEVNDVRAEALRELERRAVRAKLNSRIRPAELTQNPDRRYDGVLVDAPCTGSGTWRRSPHLKAIITPEQITSAAALQGRLLAEFSARVRPGGRLVYATCSLCVRENEAVVERFLAEHPHYASEPIPSPRSGRPAGPGVLLTPSGHDGDGFFVATLRRLP